MKKYIVLSVFTAFILCGIFWTGVSVKSSIASVSVIPVTLGQAENTVICTGKVEFSESKNVYAERGAQVNEIYVEEGETVEKGTPLMSVSLLDETEIQKNFSENQNVLSQANSLLGSNNLYNSESKLESFTTEKNQDILAPVSGQVVSVSVSKNGYINTSNPIAVISNGQDLQVRLQIDESKISEIQVGQSATITGTGFKDSAFSGTVSFISGEAQQVTSMSGQQTVVEVLVTIENPTEAIKPGFTAKAEIVTEQKQGVMLLPYEAISAEDNGQEYVYCYQENHAVKIPVETGTEYQNGCEVLSGLKKDDLVILEPELVKDGDPVKVDS